ncbi:MAG: putative porin [Pseudomonadota bacterium]
MSLRTLMTAVSLCCVTAPAMADCYRSEWGLGYVAGESSAGGYSVPDYTPPSGTTPLPPTTGGSPGSSDPITLSESSSSSEEDYDGFAVSGEVFFSPVSCDGVPLKEAAFLSQASSIGGSLAQLDTDAGADLEVWNLFTRIVASSWVFEGDVSSTRIDDDFVDSDADSLRIAIGRYFGGASQVLLAFEESEAEGLDVERLSAGVKTVVSLENGMSYTVDALVGVVRQDGFAGSDDDRYDLQLAGDWYFNNQLSIGAELEFADRDSTGSLFSYSLNSTYFVTERIAVALTYRDTDDDALAITGDQLTLEISYRR